MPTRNFFYRKASGPEQDFWTKMFYHNGKATISMEEIIKLLLGEISICRVLSSAGEVLIELGEPDYRVLPKAR